MKCQVYYQTLPWWNHLSSSPHTILFQRTKTYKLFENACQLWKYFRVIKFHLQTITSFLCAFFNQIKSLSSNCHIPHGYILLVFKVSSTRLSLCWSANSALVRKFHFLSCMCIRICGLIYNTDSATTEAKCPLQEPPFKPLFISDSLETHCSQEAMDSQHYLGKEWNQRKAYFCRDTDSKSSDRAFSY